MNTISHCQCDKFHICNKYTNILQRSLILNLYLNSLITHSLFINYSGHGLWSPTMLTLSQQPHINFITKEKAGTQYIKRLHCCWTVGRFGGVCHGPLNVLLSLFAVFSNGDLLPQSSRVTLKGTQTSHSRDFDTTWTLKPYKLQCFWMKLDLSSFDLFIVPLVEMYISLNMWGFYFLFLNSCIVALNEHGYEWTHFGNSWPVWTSFYLCLSVFNPANECICLFVNSLFKRDVHEKEMLLFQLRSVPFSTSNETTAFTWEKEAVIGSIKKLTWPQVNRQSVQRRWLTGRRLKTIRRVSFITKTGNHPPASYRPITTTSVRLDILRQKRTRMYQKQRHFYCVCDSKGRPVLPDQSATPVLITCGWTVYIFYVTKRTERS